MSLLKYFSKKKKLNNDDEQVPSFDLASSSRSTPSLMSVDVEEGDEQVLQNDSKLFFENKQAPHQPYLQAYPSKKQGDRLRSFDSNWYNKFSWLEYCENLDSCFCFACRVFLPSLKEKTFWKDGFNNWKNALAKGKGLLGHDNSQSHQEAMKLWAERTQREKENVDVRTQMTQVTSDQKEWLFAVFNVIRFLSSNGLPFRGDEEKSIEGDGLFLRVFSQLLFPMNPKLVEIHNKLPKNAKYVSAEIQNQIISILAGLVKKAIANEVRKAKLFTVYADGTTDKNRKEIQGMKIYFLWL